MKIYFIGSSCEKSHKSIFSYHLHFTIRKIDIKICLIIQGLAGDCCSVAC